jgi:hypothetical protein
VLEEFVMGVADGRHREGYAVDELHTIVHLPESRLREIIRQDISDQVDQNALLALLEAVMGAARMVISVNFIMRVNRDNLDRDPTSGQG